MLLLQAAFWKQNEDQKFQNYGQVEKGLLNPLYVYISRPWIMVLTIINSSEAICGTGE